MFNEKKIPITVQTFAGLEQVLASELKALGMQKVEETSRAVLFEGSKRDLYTVNLACRTALRALIPIATFRAEDETQLYDGVKKIEWDQIFSLEETFIIEVSTYSSNLTHTQYIAQKSKDAIADYFMEKFEARPSVDKKNPHFYIHIRLSRDECTVSLDSSGAPLYKRGYRVEQGPGPINEILAAGLIMMTDWDKKTTLLDPMCGSGTFLIEAALIAKNIPPCFLRKNYAFMNWKKQLEFDIYMFNSVKDDLFKKKTTRLNTIILGYDISYDSIKAARENIHAAKLSHEIEIKQMPFDQSIPPTGTCLVITNPPYGERVKAELEGAPELVKEPLDPTLPVEVPKTAEELAEELNILYEQIGDHLKKKYKKATAWILTSNTEAARRIGLQSSRKIKIYNGPLECRFMKFDLYEGSRKMKYEKKEES